MRTVKCKTCDKPAYVTDGVNLFVQGKQVILPPSQKAKLSFACLEKCGGWVHWEKK